MTNTALAPPLPARPFNPTPTVVLAAIVLAALCVRGLDISPETLAYAGADIVEYFGRYTQPDFADLGRYLRLLLETLATAVWGTAFAFVGGVLLAPLAARNLSPHPLAYRLARELLALSRALPDLLLALVFVAALGLGPLPGALALGVHTVGFLGKFFAESLERVPEGTYEALRATGAGPVQVLCYAGWPSIAREMAGYVCYIFDRNMRMGSVLGLVGAGGIGLALADTIKLFDYGRSAALILVLLAAILAIDALSGWVRRRLH